MAYFVWKTNILELMTKKSHRNFVSRKLNFLGKCQQKSKFFLFATTFLDCDSSTTIQMTPLEQFEIIKHMNMCNGDIGNCAAEVVTVDQTGKIRCWWTVVWFSKVCLLYHLICGMRSYIRLGWQFNMVPSISCLFLRWRGPKSIAKLDGCHGRICGSDARGEALESAGIVELENIANKRDAQ